MYPGKINCHIENNYFRVLAAFILKKEMKLYSATEKCSNTKKHICDSMLSATLLCRATETLVVDGMCQNFR